MKREDIIACMQSIGARRWNEGPKWIEFPCPFAQWTHKEGVDGKPSFGVKKSDGISGCRCQACGVSGTFFKIPARLAQRYDEGDPNIERLMALASQFEDVEVNHGTVLKSIFDDEAEVEPEEKPLDEDIYGTLYDPVESSPEALRYLAERRLPLDVAQHLSLQFDPEEGRLMFPVRDQLGVLWGFAGRSTRNAKIKVRNTRGFQKEKHILGQHLWKPGLPVILVEGLFAYARCHALGLADVGNIGAVMGSLVSDLQVAMSSHHFLSTHLWLDNDVAGMKGIYGDPADRNGKKGAMERITAQGGTPVIPTWPAGKTDPDELTCGEAVEMLAAPTEWQKKMAWPSI